MRLTIYGIGGDFAEQIVGTAYDYVTALSLIKLLRYSRATGCSVHGPLSHGAEPLSGEIGLGTLEDMLFRARTEAAIAS